MAKAADSIILGLILFRILKGRIIERFLDSIVIALLTLNFLAAYI
jgi:hypothetical protein